jgi:hypothetical protein
MPNNFGGLVRDLAQGLGDHFLDHFHSGDSALHSLDRHSSIDLFGDGVVGGKKSVFYLIGLDKTKPGQGAWFFTFCTS